MQNNLFNNENMALQTMYWWFGQIVDDKTWKENELRKKWDDPKQISGWGARYKVRIFGRDDGSVKDDSLDMAEVMYPVTAGSGHASSRQSANLSKGTYVIGFYRDGIDREDPVIIGCLGNNSQTQLSQTVPLKPFQPYSGFAGGEGVPYYSIPPGSSSPSGGSNPQESNDGSSETRKNASDKKQLEHGKEKNPIQSKCDKSELSGISKKIKQLIADVENAKKQVKDWENTVLKPINYGGQQMSVSEYIQMKVANASKDIAAFIKNIINEIRKFTTEKVNNTMKDTYYLLYPNERPELKKKVEKANDLLSCLFNKIISNLLKMIGKLLLGLLDKFVNTPLCAIENILGALLGKLTGLINSAINNILKPIEALIGQVFGIADAILGFVGQLLGFFTCEEEGSCSELKEWSIWDGADSVPTLDIDNLFNKVQQFAASVTQVIDPNNFDFDLDFSDIFQDSCNVGPLLCGPPTVSFWGGGGQGALGNAIVSAAGDIMGVDIIASGFGYTEQPFVKFYDACGKGNGAVGRALIGPVTGPDGTPTNGVVNVIIENPGADYLPSPNGDRGGDGRVWAGRCQSTIRRANGNWDTPYGEGEIMSINKGDTVKLAGQPEYIATENQSITAPGCPPDDPKVGNPASPAIQPSSTVSQYPVVMFLCDTEIANPGVAYSTTDKLIVSPDRGAILEPVYGAFGSLENVKIVSSGIGYTMRPEIYIETQTGYNAVILPVLCVNRVGDVPEDQALVPPGETIIQVVDCVGKV